MRTVDYSKILTGSAALAGMTAAEIGSAELALFASFHDRRLQEAWELVAWPELCAIEQRWFRPQWDKNYAYSPGDERFYAPANAYFQAISACTNVPPVAADGTPAVEWALCQTSYAAADWQPQTEYKAGDQVRNPGDGRFYQSRTDHASSDVWDGDDSFEWGLLTPFNRYVGWEQSEDDGTARTPIGEFLHAYDVDPRITTKRVEYGFTLSADGAQFATLRHAIAFVWLEYRQRRVELAGASWDAAAEPYAVGSQVYYADGNGLGNFYRRIAAYGQPPVPGMTGPWTPKSDPAAWAVVGIPYLMRGYLIEGGFADWLTGDGQDSKAAKHEMMAQRYLELEADKLFRQQGQARRLRWLSR